MPFVPARAAWTRSLAGALACALAAAAALAGIPVLFGSPQPKVHIQWRDIGEPDRIALERQFRLSESTRLDEDVWSYVPMDTSPEVLRAIVTHPSVDDTNGINRRVFRIGDSPPLTPRRGGLLGGRLPWMARVTRLLAYALACLAGVLLFRSALTSPFLGPESAIRRGLRGQLTDPSSALRTLPSAARAGMRRGITARSAETAAVVTLFIATVAWRFLNFTGFTNDHYIYLALAQQMLLGDRPIRDFSDPGWPLTYLVTAAGWLVAGHAMATEWTITAAGFAIGAACTVAAGVRLSGSLAIAVLVTVLEILIFPRSYSYPKVLMYGAGAWAIVGLAAQPSRRRIVLTAVIVAIAFLFRHDHGLFIGVASAVCLALATRAEGWRMAAGRVAALTAATAVFLLPWIVFVALNGGLVEYFQGGLEYSRGEANATSLTSWPRLALAPAVNTAANADAWLFWLFWSLPLLCASIACRRLLRGEQRWPGELAALAALAVLATFVNASFLRETLQVRLPDAIVPAALLGAWALGVCWIGRWRRRALQVLVRMATVAIVIVSGLAIGRISGLADQYENSDIGRGMAGVTARAIEVSALLRSPHRRDTPSRYSIALMPFFGYVDRCTSRSDRLIVTGEFPDVLVLAGRRFAGDVVFGSWYSSVAHQDRTIARLQASPALFVLHMGDYAAFRSRFGLVDTYLDGEYEPMAEVPVEEGGTIRILVHRGRFPGGIDRATGWPCFP